MLLLTKFRKKSALAAICLLAGGALSGCASWRFQGDSAAVAPPPSAPLGQVSQSDLPPPGSMGAADATGGIEPAAAADLTPAGIAGVWKVNLGGMTCQLATPQTMVGKGYRANALRCPAALAHIAAWRINGKQLVLSDTGGKDVAVLYSTNANSFSGRTGGGAPVSLSR